MTTKHTDTRPDHEIAAEQLEQAFADTGIKAAIRGGYLDTDQDGWKHYAFNILFDSGDGQSSFDWRQGVGLVERKHRMKLDPRLRPDDPANMHPIQPKPAEVLGRVCSEYQEARSMSFEDWASCFGYESDSRKAERIYQECKNNESKLSRLGLDAEVRANLAELANRL
jgi:hypothetical protein